MAANTAPIFPLAPTVGIASLTSATAITSGANITGTTGLSQLTPTSTNGKRIDKIAVRGKGTTVASSVYIWVYNGTTSYLFDTLDVSAVTVSTTTDPFYIEKAYTNLVLPPTYQIFISETVQTDLNAFAFGGDY